VLECSGHHHLHRSLFYFLGESLSCCHGSILSEVGVSGKPGAIQSASISPPMVLPWVSFPRPPVVETPARTLNCPPPNSTPPNAFASTPATPPMALPPANTPIATFVVAKGFDLAGLYPPWDNSTSRRLHVVHLGLSQAHSRAYHPSFRSPSPIRSFEAQTRVFGSARPRPSGCSSFCRDAAGG